MRTLCNPLQPCAPLCSPLRPCARTSSRCRHLEFRILWVSNVKSELLLPLRIGPFVGDRALNGSLGILVKQRKLHCVRLVLETATGMEVLRVRQVFIGKGGGTNKDRGSGMGVGKGQGAGKC